MSKIIKATPNDDYTLLVEFEHGNKIVFNMRPLIKTIPYSSLEDLERFRDITLEEKAIRRPGSSGVLLRPRKARNCRERPRPRKFSSTSQTPSACAQSGKYHP